MNTSDLLANISLRMFEGNNQFVSAGLSATEVMIFVAVVLKTYKGMNLGLSVVGCRK
jgi:hypothetical protein